MQLIHIYKTLINGVMWQGAAASLRDVQPLGMFFWAEHWLLVAWCERCEDYRCFRVDRCLQITPLDRRFCEDANRSLRDFLRKVQCEERT